MCKTVTCPIPERAFLISTLFLAPQNQYEFCNLMMSQPQNKQKCLKRFSENDVKHALSGIVRNYLKCHLNNSLKRVGQ